MPYWRVLKHSLRNRPSERYSLQTLTSSLQGALSVSGYTTDSLQLIVGGDVNITCSLRGKCTCHVIYLDPCGFPKTDEFQWGRMVIS